MRSLQEGVEEPYVLFWPPIGIEMEDTFASVAYVIMKGVGGLLLCLPIGFLPLEDLQAAEMASESSILGPHTTLSLPATHRVGAELVRTGYDIEVQVVDVAEVAERGLIKLSDCTLEEGLIQSFSDSLAVLPGLQQLLSQVTERVASNGAQRTTYYSADEGGPVEISGGKAKASTKAKAERAKKQPAAQAAAEILPTMAAQLASLREAQERIQVELQIRTVRPEPARCQPQCLLRSLRWQWAPLQRPRT